MRKGIELPETWKTIFFLAGIFLALLVIIIPRAPQYPFFLDDLKLFSQSQRIHHDWTAIWATNHGDRRHPLYMIFLFLENTFFGYQPVPYFAVLFALHFLNALLVAKLAGDLGASNCAQRLAGLFFISSSAFYQSTIFIAATIRILCFLFMLLATRNWLRYLKNPKPFLLIRVLLLQTAALLTMEDALVFPFIAAYLAWQSAEKKEIRDQIFRKGWLALFILNLAVLFPLVASFFLSPLRTDKIAGNVSLVEQLLSFVKMLVQPLFIPEKGFFSLPVFWEMVLRLIPAVFFLSGILFFWVSFKDRRNFFKETRSSVFLTGMVWITISVIPYLLHPITFEHATRHFYFPMAGFSLVLGTAMDFFLKSAASGPFPKTGKAFFLTLITYAVVLNLTATAFHYDRYVRYIAEHPEEGYRYQIQEIFSDKR